MSKDGVLKVPRKLRVYYQKIMAFCILYLTKQKKINTGLLLTIFSEIVFPLFPPPRPWLALAAIGRERKYNYEPPSK